MSGLEGLLAILIVAAMPVALVWITRYYSYKEKELATEMEMAELAYKSVGANNQISNGPQKPQLLPAPRLNLGIAAPVLSESKWPVESSPNDIARMPKAEGLGPR